MEQVGFSPTVFALGERCFLNARKKHTVLGCVCVVKRKGRWTYLRRAGVELDEGCSVIGREFWRFRKFGRLNRTIFLVLFLDASKFLNHFCDAYPLI